MIQRIDHNRLREDAVRIFRAAIRAANARGAVERAVRLEGDKLIVHGRPVRLPSSARVWIVGAGKASAPMAAALEEILGDRVAGGVVVVKDGHAVPTRKVKVVEASHPVPDMRGLEGAREILDIVHGAASEDLIFCVISGGGSALMPFPADGITLEEKQRVTELLLGCGANIQEMNCVRKHLSRIKGGQLARAAYPRTVVSLLISDVIGDRLDTIASGPTAPDSTTYEDALSILEKYGLLPRLRGTTALEALREGAEGRRPETPKPGDPVFQRVHNVIVASNGTALAEAEAEARLLGYNTLVLTTRLEGEAREAGRLLASLAWEIWENDRPVRKPACLLAGGETTVTLDERGKGGRNQELALAASLSLPPTDQVVLLSGGTDGTDGPTDAAGAVVDGLSAGRARTLGLEPADFLRGHNAYPLFQRTGELLFTGPTETNVMDAIVLLVGGDDAEDENRLHDRSSLRG